MISKEKLTQKLSIWVLSRSPWKKRKEIIMFRAASCFAGRRQKVEKEKELICLETFLLLPENQQQSSKMFCKKFFLLRSGLCLVPAAILASHDGKISLCIEVWREEREWRWRNGKGKKRFLSSPSETKVWAYMQRGKANKHTHHPRTLPLLSSGNRYPKTERKGINIAAAPSFP